MTSAQNVIGYKLAKSNLKKLINLLRKEGNVIAPKQDNHWLRMLPLTNIKQLKTDGISWYSSKKYVFPQNQVLFEFDSTNITEPKTNNTKTILFGLRACDLNSFRINDELFLKQEPSNSRYKQNRENLILVGLWCDKQVDEYCFCDSVELEHCYDLCLFDRGKYYHIKSGSKIGDELIKKLKIKAKEEYIAELPNCERKLLTTDIEKYFDRDDVWMQGAIDCLSCGDCTSLCPTCLCFDIEDDVNLDLKSGQRIIKTDSCMYRDFTTVAGGHVFRDARVARFKHRFFHKLVYFKKKTGSLMCTGCGRCIRGCPTKIDWIELINNMEAQK